MGMFDKNDFGGSRFGSHKQDYATPQKLFDNLNKEFSFTLDVCADESNHKCENYFSEEDNALLKDWNGVCWMNPPYDNKKNWVIKAYKESIKNDCVVVCLIPARTNTSWWHDYCQKGEIRFIKGRPIFEGMTHGLPQPLAIVIFGKSFFSNYKTVEIK
jgi:phage N-6-adenine-methyltransferase